MSTSSECRLIEVSRGSWFYILEDFNACDPDSEDDSDWQENANSYGPFATEEAANAHLRENHCNPGGSQTSPLPPGMESLDLSKDPVLRDWVERARSPHVQQQQSSLRLRVC